MTSHYRCPVRLLGFLLAAAGCFPAGERPQAHQETTTTSLSANFPDTTSGGAADDGQWVMPARNFASTRYSGISEITTQNVGQLRLAWSFSTGVQRGHEAAPLVVRSMMYVVTPFPNLLHAFDLTKPGAPPKWTYTPSPAPTSQGVACCDVVNRGAAFSGATLSSETVHTVQHVSFLGTALLFCRWAVLHGVGTRLARPAAVIYLFTTAVHTSLLGALLTFSRRLWYPLYDATTTPWGLTPLEDRQLAGVIMWVPAGLSYLIAALALAATWLREPPRRFFQPIPLP